MQKPNLQFETEDDLKNFLREAEEKKEKEKNGDQVKEEWRAADPKVRAARHDGERQYMNNAYHYYRMLIILAIGITLIAIGDKLLTAIGVGCVAIAIILHQATMSIVIREELK